MDTDENVSELELEKRITRKRQRVQFNEQQKNDTEKTEKSASRDLNG